jgi:hypothetical protein
VGAYNAVGSDGECHFVCDEGYERDNTACIAFAIIHNPTEGTITVKNGTTTYTIRDKNLGASVAGTGASSYGNYYQRGNNYGFANT